MTISRLPAVGVITGTALLLWASSAAAVTPVLSCVAPRPGGFTAYYGYSNPTGGNVTIGIGTTNRITPAPSDRGQPTLFLPDTPPQPGYADTRTQIAAAVDFTGAISWNLDGASAPASGGSTRCRFDLTIAASADRAEARPGEDVVWSVVVRNSGTSPIPRSQIIFTTTGLPPLSIAGNPPDELLPGEVLTYRGITRPTVAECGRSIEGTGDVGIGPGQVETREADLTNNSARAAFTVRCISDLGITASSDATTYSPGQNAVYTLTITNTGDVTVPTSAIGVTDPALTGLAPVGTPPATLAPRESFTYRGTRPVTQEMCATGTANAATVAFINPAITDANPSNNTASRPVTVAGGTCTAVTPVPQGGGGVTVQRTTLSLSKVGSARVRVGGLGTYLITVRNSGRNTAKRVVLRDFAPQGAALTGTPDGATLVAGRPVWRLGDIPAGTSRTVRVSVRFGSGAPGARVGSAVALASNASTVRTAFEVQVVARPQRRPPAQPRVTG